MEESCLFCGCEDGLVKCPDCPALACPAHLPLHTRGGSCLPWCVGSAGPAGRGLFTTRLVEAGEVVVRDFAVVAGPLPDAEVCASCLAGEDVAQCGSGCGLLVCTQRSKQCREVHRRECQLLTESGLKGDARFSLLAAARLLWRLERDPAARQLLEPLLDHSELLREDEDKAAVVKCLTGRGSWQPDQVWRALGLLQTNGVTSHTAGGRALAHGLYPVFSVANTRHGREGEAFTLVATVNIKQGEEITTSYR